MDDLLREFLTETNESLDTVDVELVRFEQEPNNAKILDNIFRLVHTIRGTCGFLGLPRLEALAHAGDTLMGKFRDGMPVRAEAVTVILSSIDRIKEILAGLEATEAEPEGNDRALTDQLGAMVGMAPMSASAPPIASRSASPIASGSASPMPTAGAAAPAPAAAPQPAAAPPPAEVPEGTLVVQTLERPLRPGEVSLDELERAFRETVVEAEPTPVAPAAVSEPAAPKVAAKKDATKGSAKDATKE